MDRTQRPKARPNLKTNETTPGGRTIWKDKDTGENYSERTTSFDIGGVWYTMPTVAEDGTEYSTESVRNYVLDNGPVDFITGEELPTFSSEKEAVDYAIKRSDTRRPKKNDTGYAQGGAIKMNNKGLMKKMYKEGGLATDGMDVDPISGNDIPPGSNAEDVRDDVDLKASGGEYIVPADVVKYFGVAYFEKLRSKAKAGLEEMDEDGRIGGEPVMEDEDPGMPEGNYAIGGMVPGSDIDNISERVKAAAVRDPSAANMLKAKGIFIQEPQPQGQNQQQAMSEGTVPAQAAPPKMQGLASPTGYKDGGMIAPAGYAPGGMVAPNPTSKFNPYAYKPGFSALTNVTGQAPGAPAIPGPQGETCSVGYMWDTTKGMCVPDPNAAAVAPTPVATPKSNDNDSMPITPADPNKWMEKYDYSSPDTLYDQTMTTLGGGPETEEDKGFISNLAGAIGGIFEMGLLGKMMNAGKASEAKANSALLRQKGFNEQADKLDVQIKSFMKEKSLGFLKSFVSGKSLADSVMKTDRAGKISQWSTDPTVLAVDATTTPAYSATKSANPTLERTTGLLPSKTGKRKDSSQSDNDDSFHKDMVSAAKERGAALKKSNAAVGAASAKLESSQESEKSYEDSAKAAGATRGIGGQYGMAKGGLVSPRAAKTLTPKTKNNNTKGLGRR